MSQTPGTETKAGTTWRSRPAGVWLYVLGAFVLCITAVPSGILMLADPSGELMGLDVVWLEGTPFDDFLVPGLVLFGVLGIGSFIVLYGIGDRRPWAWWSAVGLGVALIGWITVQVLVLRMFHVLQVVYGFLGLALLVLAVLPSSRAFLRSA